ncbi:DUF6483 family protein [Paenibacillus mendelii]|uniref:DUF6483 family protein n=1 Tax=Paenibacillus mendelii TaxID=206163 RepID=A0ABV6JJ06_9BACL|nr:DUF6483 family protein [Paenibacillus mendelii]MCQ6558826.1 DUF6483 family protein [Paenibacillus mendelii]
MFQRDYFMRMIEQMSVVVGQVMGLRRERKQEEALLVIDELLDREFRLNAKLIRSLSDRDLIAMMTRNGIVETANVYAIARLLKEEGDLHEELQRPESSYPSRLKSLHLFIRLALLDAPSVLKTPTEEAFELLADLKGYELPAETKQLLLEWHEAERRYDLAENVLYELMEDDVLTKADADDFYSRLLLLPEESLEAGGLPRDEIIDGRRQLYA